MAFLETRVRVRHRCPYCNLSVAFPDVEMDLWTSTRSDVFHVTAASPARLRGALRAMRQTIGARKITYGESSALVITHRAQWDYPPSVTGIADRQNVWLIPPVLYYGGWETYRALSPNQVALRRFVAQVKRVGTVEVLSHRARDRLEGIRSLGTVPVHLFEGLTERQIHVLVAALEGGLFELPARQKMDRVARREGLSRSTFGEHLRKAETQVLQNSYPFLKLRDEAGASMSESPLRRSRGARGMSPVGLTGEAGES